MLFGGGVLIDFLLRASPAHATSNFDVRHGVWLQCAAQLLLDGSDLGQASMVLAGAVLEQLGNGANERLVKSYFFS